jgi:tetratricopeptide (TPR) repeat protein
MTDMDTGKVDPGTQAALDLARTYLFGTEPGRIPAVLYAAYEASAADLDRALLSAELARCWVYSRERIRAVPFAVAAVKHAEATGDPAVLANALDSALATHWGPDELEVRVDLAGKLADVAAHLGDAESRLKAHLWLLTVAAETLDVSALNRQVRALERLGEESRKALFFAVTRRLMLDLMRGRADTVAALLALARETADTLPDGDMVVLALSGYGAVQAGDRSDEAVLVARDGEALAEQEGIREVSAELAWIYLGIGLPDDARRLASTFDPLVLSGLPRDHNYLLILQLLLDVALATGLDELVETITPLLLPYAGRAVINAGAVMFHGVTDDTLARACQRLGDAERAAALREKALATYRRIGATWWRERLEANSPSTADSPSTSEPERITVMTLRPGPAGVWFVGRGPVESPIPARRGLEHLHALLTRPGTEVSALRLAGGAETVEQGGLGEVVDAQALTAYRSRLAEIDTALDDADQSSDVVRSVKLTAERDALLAQVSAATGLGGRPRTTGSGAERARITVRKAIATALDAVHSADPVVARHLTTHVRTGLRCSYQPDPDVAVDWRL